MVEVKVIAGDTFLLEALFPTLPQRNGQRPLLRPLAGRLSTLLKLSCRNRPRWNLSSIVETDEGKDSPQPVETVQTVSDSAAESIVEEGWFQLQMSTIGPMRSSRSWRSRALNRVVRMLSF